MSVKTPITRPGAASANQERPRRKSVEVSKVKRLLVGMLIVGAITAATASGTFATFSASTTNSGTVTSGTLLLGNTVGAGTECFSQAVQYRGPF